MSSPIDQPGSYPPGPGGAYEPYQANSYPPNPAGAYPAADYPAQAYPAQAYQQPGYQQPEYQPAASSGAHALQAEPQERSLGDLVGSITADLSTLMQQEVALAKAEATQSAKRAGKGAGMLGGAGLAGYFTVLFLSIALWWALGVHIGHGWAALIVAVLWGIVAAVLAARGRKELAEVRGLDRTTETLGKIPNALQGNERQNR